MTIACQIVASLGALRAMFGSPPDSAKLQAWWHWMDDSYTPETLRADIDAMAALGIGAAHVFEPGAYFPIRRFWCRMMSDEWLLRFDSALALAKERGIALGFHNCPGWSSSGGPWIDYAHSMKIVVAGCVDLSGSERSVVVPCSKAVVGGFHRDISLLAVQIPDDPGPSRASRAFPTTLRIAEKGSADSMVFEFDGGVPPVGTMILEWADGSHHSVVDVESSADGLVWRLLGRHHLMYYNSPLTPKTVSFDEPSPGDRFIRVTFRYVESPAHVRHKDVVLHAVSFSSIRHVDDLDDKAGLRGHGLAYRPPADGKASLPGLDAGTMRNISKFMDGDGRVDLVAAGLPAPAPGRRWRLLRLGFTSTGKKCSPSTLQGLECDKLDRSGIEAHWPHMPARLAARPGAKGTLKYCIIDSYEAGGQNWTDDMPAKFSRLRGYDMMRYLPALVGYVVGSVGETEKFLYDFQRTIADLFVCEYYGRFAELCRGEGLVPVVEGYDGTFDPMEACAAADIPCGEFWIGGTGASNARADKTPTWAASAAHLKGSAIVAAESFTTGAKEGRWQATPAQLRREGDRAWLFGVNQLVYHSYVAQPFANVKPGYSLASHGTHLNRNTPWFPEARAWSDYVARSQALLQSGTNHAEIIVMSGDSNAYLCMEPPKGVVESGMSFDWLPAKWLSRLVPCGGGRVGMPGLPAYEVLDLGDDRHLTVATLREVKRLKDAGVRIRARRPLGTPSLSDDDGEWSRLADDVFGGGDIAPLMPRPFADSGGALKARRRDAAGVAIYYLLNDSEAAFSGRVSFAAPSGARAERWDAESGLTEALPVAADGEGRVSVALGIPPGRSVFVVLSPECDEFLPRQRDWSPTEELEMNPCWKVSFRGLGAPDGERNFPFLRSWSLSDDPRIRYFSGRATYKTRFIQPFSPLLRPSRFRLELGDVADVARVWVNGKEAGILWQAPFAVDVSDFVREGANELQVEVANNWPNRMIGDAAVREANPGAETFASADEWFPEEAGSVFSPPQGAWYPKWVVDDRTDSGTGIYTWSNYANAWSADEPLLPAGLLGPVKVIRMEE